jgi:hypothetical protein
MPRKADAAALAILLLVGEAGSLLAQETARPVAPSVTGVVPGLVRAIPLWNRSRRELRFFVHEAGGWRAYTLAPGGEAELPFRDVVIAIGTARNPQDEDAFAAPRLDDEAVRRVGPGLTSEAPHLLRRLEAGRKFELCWSQARAAWVIQAAGEAFCS